jgi:tetratricopeptide (TPR) repeat protein
VRGYIDFQSLYRNSSTRDSLAAALTGPGEEGAKRLELLYAAMQHTPNADPVRLFWRYKGNYLTGTFEYYTRGRVFAELDEHARAVEQFTLAIERNPLDHLLLASRGESRRALARAAQLAGKTKEAEKAFQLAISDFHKAVDPNPFFVEALLARGTTFCLVEKYKQAVEDFTRVLAMADDNVAALNERAAAYQLLDRLPESIRDLEKAIGLAPGHVVSYVHLANAYRLSGQFDKAEEQFEKAIQLNSEAPDIYHHRGLLYAAMRPPRYGAAYREFEKAIELGSDEPAVVYKDWGITYYQAGDYPKAVVVFDLATAANKSYALAYCWRGLAYAAARQPAEAVKDYTYVIENINDEYADAYVNRGIAYSSQGEYEVALKDLQRGMALAPDQPAAYVARGRVHSEMKHYHAAIADYTTAIELQERLPARPGRPAARTPEAHNNLGHVYTLEGEYQRAIACFDRALEIDPNCAEAYNNRGLVRRAQGKHTLARNDFTEAIRRDPDNAVYYYNRGLNDSDSKQYQEALTDFNSAIHRNEKYEEALLARSEIYESRGEYNKASADVNRALEINPASVAARNRQADLQVRAQKAPPPP